MKKEIDLDLIRRVTDNFFFWQGYRFVPVGVVFLLYALSIIKPSWLPEDDWFTVGVPTAVLLITFLLYSRISAYYRNHFGRVRGIPGKHAMRDAIKWAVFYPALAGAMVLDYKLRAPVFISGLAGCASIIGYWWSTGKGREHYLVAAAAMAVSAFLPTLQIVTDWKVLFAIFFALLGITYIIGGILDHHALTRIFHHTDEEDRNTI